MPDKPTPSLAACVLALALAACGSPPLERTPGPITPEAVVAFLNDFEALAEREDFALIRDLIDEAAYFRYNDGDFVGRAAIQAAFEKAWRGDPTVKKARFHLSNITVLTVDTHTASATYTWHWEGRQGERAFSIRGRGSRVLVQRDGQFRIVHEHLSRFPAGP